MVVKEYYKYYVTKRRLYQHWPGSLIRECIIMVITTRNGTFLNESLRKQQENPAYLKWLQVHMDGRNSGYCIF